jgi:hypothetical protein
MTVTTANYCFGSSTPGGPAITATIAIGCTANSGCSIQAQYRYLMP